MRGICCTPGAIISKALAPRAAALLTALLVSLPQLRPTRTAAFLKGIGAPPAPCPGPVTNAALPARRIAQHPIRRSAFRPSTGPQEIWYPGRDRFRKTGRTPCPILPQSLRMLKSQLEKNHYPVKEENMRLFENVKEDDNLVLVFFKIKDL